jgi:tyrosyl-tRNA synthetase
MSLKDELIETYFSLATTVGTEGVDFSNPLIAKKQLAFQIVSELYNKEKAQEAEEYFEKTFQKAEPEFNEKLPLTGEGTVSDVLSGKVGSTSELKRLIHAGAVEVNGELVDNIKMQLKSGDKVKVGKRGFYHVS